MLKNIFSRIKSEKQSTIKSQKNNQPSNQHQPFDKHSNQLSHQVFLSPLNEALLAQNLKSQASLESSIVQGPIQKVRYWANIQLPNIFTKVLSCPISHFNLLPHSKRKVKQIDLKKDKFPEYLECLKPLLKQHLPSYNHILINHYPKGIGIMHHFDGPLYNDRVVVLSLGGPAIISFQSGYSKETQSMKILLQDNSIHIFQQSAYTKYLHGIEDKKIDSFTFTIRKKSISMIDIEQKASIKLKDKFNNCVYELSESSIHNLSKLNSILNLIEKNLNSLVFEQSQKQTNQYCIEFEEGENIHKLKGMFIFIRCVQSQNDVPQKNRWKWKLQIERQQRISITIREKYQTSSF